MHTRTRERIKTYHYAVGLQTRVGFVRGDVLKMRPCAFGCFVIALWLVTFPDNRLPAILQLSVGKRLAVCRQIQAFAQTFHARARARVNAKERENAEKEIGI